MTRRSDQRKRSPGRRMLLATACLLLGSGPLPAEGQPSPREQELRRQLEIERAARKTLMYQADMRQAAQLAEAEEWGAAGQAAQPVSAGRRRVRLAGLGMALP